MKETAITCLILGISIGGIGAHYLWPQPEKTTTKLAATTAERPPISKSDIDADLRSVAESFPEVGTYQLVSIQETDGYMRIYKLNTKSGNLEKLSRTDIPLKKPQSGLTHIVAEGWSDANQSYSDALESATRNRDAIDAGGWENVAPDVAIDRKSAK